MGRVSIAAIVAGILGIGAGRSVLGSTGGHHESGDRPRACSNATLKGTYGIQIVGTRPAPGGTESVIGVLIRHYDGNGQFTQVDNVKGSVTGWTPDRTGFGTYDVSRDCTAIAQATPGPNILLEERLVIVDDGREVRSATMLPPPVMVTGVGIRLHND